MAITGMQNVSVVDSSILGDSRVLSSSSPSQQNGLRIGVSRASLILQMWRELEDGFLADSRHQMVRESLQTGSSNELSSSFLSSNMSHDQNISQDQDGRISVGLEGPTQSGIGRETFGENAMASQSEQEDNFSNPVVQSQGNGEVERKKVREVFQVWRSTGANGLTSPGPSVNSSPRAQLLDQTEIDRIRVVREWVQMACQKTDNSGGNHKEQRAEIDGQIERVRNGLSLDNIEVCTSSRRGIRILCGRQALLDLLQNRKQEGERELQILLQHNPVRKFAYRKKIQSLLRVRMMHIRGLVENTRTNTAAESELGILRQRQTVSGLREEFLSRMQNNVPAQTDQHSSSLPDNDTGVLREDGAQFNSSGEVLDDEHGRDYSSAPSPFCTDDSQCNPHVISQGCGGQIGPSLGNNPVGGDRQEVLANEISATTDPEDAERGIWRVNCDRESSEPSATEQVQFEDTNQVYSESLGDRELQLHLDSSSNSENVQLAGIHGPEDRIGGLRLLSPEDVSRRGSIEHAHLEEMHEQQAHVNEHRDLQDVSSHSVIMEDSGSEDAHIGDSNTQRDEGHEWIGPSLLNGSRDGNQEEMDQEEWRDGASDGSSNDTTWGNEGGGQSQLEGFFRHGSVSQQTLTDRSALLSETGGLSARRLDLYYHSDDDSAHNIELEELLSRRRVSALLHSGFRENLEQIIQSHVERQNHAPVDHELHEMLPLAVHDQDQDHVNPNINDSSNDADSHSDITQSATEGPPDRIWERRLHDFSRARDMHQRPGIALEMISDLSVEMARLHHRLDHIQTMLEAFMDMQLDLRRSIRQEVSAALNRSFESSEPFDPVSLIPGSGWDCLRRGICCLCCESNIDSLLYRCGHMCACSKCAGILVKGKGKCPMCQAPIIEVIRAYTIQ